MFKILVTYLFVFIIFLLCFYGINSCVSKPIRVLHLEERLHDTSYTAYVRNVYWHTGIIIPVDSSIRKIFSKSFSHEKAQFLDFGWGDEDFYQYEGDFDLFLAAKAILIPTSSVIRVQILFQPLEEIIAKSDNLFEIKLTKEKYARLLAFILFTFELDNSGNTMFKSARDTENITFYQARNYYYLFNTCNTWVAEALEFSGFEISSNFVITKEQLISRIEEISRKVK